MTTNLHSSAPQPSGALHELPWLPRASADFSAKCRELAAQPTDFGRRIRELATAALDENQLARLAKLIASGRTKGYSLEPLAPFRLAIISNATTDFMAPCLVATAARYGIALTCHTSGYGQVIQEVLNPASALNQFEPQAVLVSIDWRGLPINIAPGQPTAATVDAVLSYFQTIRDGLKANAPGAVCIIQNLAAPAERYLGSFDRVLPGGGRQVFDQINEALAASVRDSGGALLDVAGMAESVGLAQWHSPQEWNMAKIPFASLFLPLFADHVCRILGALRGKSRRCLVLDLDNTVWGGVIGDDGLAGIQIAEGDPAGEAFREFQRYALMLREHGVVLAVSSKNEDETARLPFRKHPEMLLRENHIAVFQANWRDKPTNIQAIADELSLGLESFVFVDDNPFERELVRTTLPEVAVPEMPADPALYARTLSAAGYFEGVAFSIEDAKRAGYYQENAMRAALQKQVGDVDAYLATLAMEIWFQPFDETNRARIAQLISKSNQFNLTTRRYSEADVAEMQDSPETFTLQVRLKDTFGDNGMISVVICRQTNPVEWDIDTWLMSCRVLGRRVENMVLREVLRHAMELGIRRLTGSFIPTDRNKLVRDHYRNLGFECTAERAGGGNDWSMDVSEASINKVPGAPMIVHSSGFASQLVSAHADGSASR